MRKKGFFIAGSIFFILLAVLIRTFAQDVPGGCCITGANPEDPLSFSCEQVADPGQCTGPGRTYTGQDCNQRPECDYGCCSAIVNPSDRETFRGSCAEIAPETAFEKLIAYDPEKIVAYDSQNACTLPTCTAQSCQDDVTACLCGDAVILQGESKFCCALDNQAFADQSSCQASPSCRPAAQQTFSVSGFVRNSQNARLQNAVVTLDGRSTTTNAAGDFFFTNVATATYVVSASKTGYSTDQESIEVINQPLQGIELIIDIVTQDTDGDGAADNVDECDVEPAIIQKAGDPDYDGTNEARCSDGIDNDCDGTVYYGANEPNNNGQDCGDPDCRTKPECQQRAQGTCGDGSVQGPPLGNSLGIIEQCDDGNILAGDGCNQICQSEISQCPPAAQCCSDTDCASFGPDYLCINNRCEEQIVAVCGNGFVEGLEECDIGNNSLSTEDDVDTLEEGAIFYTCAGLCGNSPVSQCQCLTHALCGDGAITSPYETCEADADCDSWEGQGTCSSCNCQYPCLENPQAPANLQATNEKGFSINTISWTLETTCELEHYNLYRCVGGNCEAADAAFTFIGTASNTVYTYDDADNIQPETDYCYKVGAYYANGKENTSAIACLTSKDAFCMENPGEFCRENAGYLCDRNTGIMTPIPGKDCNIFGRQGEGQYLCVERDAIVDCVYQSKCDVCNGVLGLFWLAGLEVDWKDPNLGMGLLKFPCSEITTCYVDYTETTVEAYQACSEVESCYDYQSEEACLEDADKCSIGPCEWLPDSEYGEVGKGVCRPIAEEQQDCNQCEADSKEFFESCTASRCGLYGACLFVNGDCTEKAVASCLDYGEDSEACTGGQPIQLEVEWTGTNCNPTMENCYKMGGSNTFTPSNDALGLGKCEAVTYRGKTFCIRNADNNNFELSDCLPNRPKYASCESDYEAPVTTLNPNTKFVDGKPLFGRNSMIEVFVEDNVFEQNAPAEITTWACISENVCYPTEKVFDNHIQFTFDENLEGNYKIYYFSEDLARNLEEIKSLDVLLDTIPPVVQFSTEVHDIRDNQGDWWTNLTITIDVTDNGDEIVQCSTNLTLDGEVLQPVNNIHGEFGNHFVRTYFDLEDAIYVLHYACMDNAGNIAEGNEEIGIEMDDSIMNPMPKGVFGPFNATPFDQLAVDTAQPAACYGAWDVGWFDSDSAYYWDRNLEGTDSYFPLLQQNTPGGKSFAFQPGAGGTHHTANYFINDHKTEPYVFNVKCMFTSDNSIHGNRNDRIVFSTDFSAPHITVVDCVAGEPFPTGNYFGEEVQVCFACDDTTLLTLDHIEDPAERERLQASAKNFHKDFGCQALAYTLTTDAGPISGRLDFSQGNAISEPVTLGQSTTISYSAADKGGNVGEGYFTIYIDLNAPLFNASIYRELSPQAKPLQEFGFGSYLVVVEADKALRRIAASLEIGGGYGPVPLTVYSKSEDNRTSIWAFNVPKEKNWKDKSLPALFSIDAEDIYGHLAEHDFDFTFNTNPPPPPVLEPLFDGNTMPNGTDFLGYPLQYNPAAKLYYTNQQQLFITGKTSVQEEAPSQIHYYLAVTPTDRAQPRVTYDQNSNAGKQPLSKTRVFTDHAQGETQIRVHDDNGAEIGDAFRPGHYVHFTNHVREQYGFYHTYYRIKDVVLINIAESVIILEEPLEQAVPGETEVEAFASAYPYNWFGIYVPLQEATQKFTIIAQDAFGNFAFPEEEFTIIYDPYPLQIVSHTPFAGTSGDNASNVSILLKEVKEPGSRLNRDSILFRINGQLIPDFAITEYEDEQFIYYAIAYDPVESLNGTYTVTFTAKDYATNLVEVSWVFEIDRNKPGKPTFTVTNGRNVGGVWYTAQQPSLEITFPDNEQVNLEELFVGNLNTLLDADCTRTEGNTFQNTFQCSLNQPLTPIIENGALQKDTFNILITAKKVLLDGTESGVGVYRDNFIVVDTLPPLIKGLVDFKGRIRDNANVTLKVNISNELHGVDAKIVYLGNEYSLILVADPSTGSPVHVFRWEVPDFNPTANPEVQQSNAFQLIVTDFVGNSDTFAGQLLIDLMPPDISAITVDVVEAQYKDPSIGFFATNIILVTIEGTFTDSDIETAFVMLGSYNPRTGGNEPTTSGTLLLQETPPKFRIQLQLNGPFSAETLNEHTLYLRDLAGYEVGKSLAILADLKPPEVTEESVS